MKKLAVCLVMWAGYVQMAGAFCLEPQPRLVCAEYFASQAVVEATLLRIEPVLEHNDPDDIDGYFYTLKSNRQLRGTIAPTFRIYEGNDSGRASFDWKIGTTYLLFLFPSHEKRDTNAWALDGCGNSGPLANSAAALGRISRINPRASFGTVQGVVSDPTLSLGLESVRVTIRGTSATFEATTDKKGRFTVNVPPGEYSIETKDPSRPLAPDELSYEDPRHFHIEPGGCAQVQLTQTPNRR